MENFKQFCINITNPNLPDVDTDSMDYEMEDTRIIDNITTDIKNKLGFIDRISVPYIEGRFDNLDNVGKILEVTGNEDIPDELLNLIANKVYEKPFNSLSNDERSIIAVLSVYILIYNFKGGALL
jgi:hypothetical protein